MSMGDGVGGFRRIECSRGVNDSYRAGTGLRFAYELESVVSPLKRVCLLGGVAAVGSGRMIASDYVRDERRLWTGRVSLHGGRPQRLK